MTNMLGGVNLFEHAKCGHNELSAHTFVIIIAVVILGHFRPLCPGGGPG